MTPALKIAWRYFRAKKSLQAIHIVSRISMAAIAISTAAMVILFSVYNGLENTIKEMYTSFYPDLKVRPVTGKFFALDDSTTSRLRTLRGIGKVSFTLEDMVLLAHGEEQRAATLKGIDSRWEQVTAFDQFMLDGSERWRDNALYNPVLLGLNLMVDLRIDLDNDFSRVLVFYPRSGQRFTPLNPQAALNRLDLKPMGVFHVQDEFDSKYVLGDIAMVQDLFGKPATYSALEIQVKPGEDEDALREELEEIMGPQFQIANRFEQNKTLYLVMQSEKWAIYAILLLVLVIASFNMVGSQSMLVLEKSKDIFILKAMGAEDRLVRRVFLLQGLFMAFAGGLAGIVLGGMVCLGQIYFGWIGMPDGFAMQAYPVAFHVTDFLIVIVTVGLVGWGASLFPARQAARRRTYIREE